MPGPFTSPVARSTPFDDAIAQLGAEDVQTAIEALKTYINGIARFAVCAGFDGTASTGRWLEFITNVPSNTSPFILARSGALKELTLVGGNASQTGTVTIYKNGSAWTTIALAAQKKNAIVGLNLTFNALDEISMRLTAGSIPQPMCYIFVVYT